MFRSLTHAHDVAKAFPEWFSHGNGRRWRAWVKGAVFERKQTVKVTCGFPKGGGKAKSQVRKS